MRMYSLTISIYDQLFWNNSMCEEMVCMTWAEAILFEKCFCVLKRYKRLT